MIKAIFEIIQILLNVVWLIVFVQVILSILIAFNVINTYNEYVRAVWDGLNRLTEPLYRPLRRILPDARPLDLAPLAVFVLLNILQSVIVPYLHVVIASALA